MFEDWRSSNALIPIRISEKCAGVHRSRRYEGRIRGDAIAFVSLRPVCIAALSVGESCDHG